ncbi:putative cytochrome P450 [Annulohypoxylon moriforme]|nr:putative cytochrome P450 [Annulohypoxylon moriforme]
MAAVMIFAGIIALLCLYVIRRRVGSSHLPLPPGPRPLPIIGNVHQAPKSHSWKQFHAWGKTYGPIFHLNMLGQHVIVLSTSKAAHELLAKRGATFSDRPRLVLAGELALKGLNTLLMPYDDRFRLHQRLENSVLNQKASSAYLPFQAMESKQMLFDLLMNAGGAGTDCHGYFERTAASTIFALFYGFRVKNAEDPTLQAVLALDEDFSQFVRVGEHIVDTFPVLNNLPSFLAPWKVKAESHWRRQCALHGGNLQRGLAGPGWAFVKQVHSIIQDERISMPTEELALEFGTLVDAALDGTTETLNWFVIACITQNRDFITKARKDLDAVVGRDRLPSFEDKPNLLCIKSTYEGYRIPAGSTVIANHWAITREEAVFGPDPNSFRPERWLGPEGTEGKELKNLPIVGFGYGRRTCPGRHFARNVVWITIARLLWAFEIEPGLSEETGKPEFIDDEASTDGLVMRPLPFKVSFEPRGPWVRDIIMRECDTWGEDFTALLSKIGKDLAKQ